MRAAAVAVLMLLSGCASSSSSTDTVTVTVSGTLGFTGGVAAPGRPPYIAMPGTVMLTGGGTTRSVTADANGHFSARVPPGVYIVTGNSSHFTVNGVRGTCTAVGGAVDASHDRSGVVVLCAGK